MALREAIKGWAIAAKKLPFKSGFSQEEEEAKIIPPQFIFGNILLNKYENISGTRNTWQKEQRKDQELGLKKNQIIQHATQSIEKNLLPDYLQLCRSDFQKYLKKDYFWALRVQLEKEILNILDIFPHLVFSPYNVIVKLTQRYTHFYELLYLLSENFPTLAMQRLMFSGFLMMKTDLQNGE